MSWKYGSVISNGRWMKTWKITFLRAECDVTGHVSVDIPFRITRNTRTKEIQSKRMKKGYCIVYNKRVITEDYKAIPYGY